MLIRRFTVCTESIRYREAEGTGFRSYRERQPMTYRHPPGQGKSPQQTGLVVLARTREHGSVAVSEATLAIKTRGNRI